MGRESWGIIDRQKSGRYRARYTHRGQRHAAPATFDTKGEARAWLAKQRTAIAGGTWVHPDEAARIAEQEATETARAARPFGEYAAQWVKTRTNSKGEPLRPRTEKEYRRMLDSGYLADWKDTPLNEIRSDDVREWRSEKLATGKATQTARAYDLMKSILKTAVEDGVLSDNPCKVRGGSSTSTGRKTDPPTDDELDKIIDSIEDRYKALVIIAAAGGLRYGEALALATDDVLVERDADGVVDAVRVSVTKSVVEGAGLARELGPTKTAAGERVIAIFGRDAELVAKHVEGIGSGLLWRDTQGGYVSQSSVNNAWRKAKTAAGLPDLTFHTLRHYAGTRYAQSGATIAETMARLGHSSAKAAMRYQHAGSRDDELARRAAR